MYSQDNIAIKGVWTGSYLNSGHKDVVNVSAEFDDVMKLRFVTLGTWGREPFGCSRNLTTDRGHYPSDYSRL